MDQTQNAATTPRPLDVFAIVCNPRTGAVLLRETSAGLTLPAWQEVEEQLWEGMDWVNRRVSEITGRGVAALRCLQRDWDRTDGARRSIYLLEALGTGWQPEHGWSWFGRDIVSDPRFATIAGREILADWFDRDRGRPNAPWYRPGWYESTSGWIVKTLETLGIATLAPVEQVKSWSRSAVMRVETDAGLVYFKAVPEALSHEFTVSEAVRRIAPERVPALLAHDPANHRALIEQIPGGPLSATTSIETWEDAYRRYAQLQRRLIEETPGLLAAGVPDHRLPVIGARIDDLLGDDELLMTGRGGGLTREQAERLSSSAGLLSEALAELAESEFPASLDHGDFWPGNIYVDDGRPVYFDWSDATVTHPFLSLIMTVEEVSAGLTNIERAGERVRDAYLEAWTAEISIERARHLFDLAMLVAPLHQALLYRTRILPALDSRWELERMAPMFLRWLVDVELPRQARLE